ncbi:MAG: hypothetical protein ACLGHZ_09365 [Actinomycetes bacterium]
MSWLTLLLLGIGVADLLAAARPDLERAHPPLSRWVVTALAGLLVVTVGGLAGFDAASDWVAVGFVVASMALWRWMLRSGETSPQAARRTLACLVLPAVVLVALSGLAAPVGGPLAAWLAWMDLPALARFSPGRVLLLAALAVVNTATANLVVRLVLVSVDARPPRLGAHARDDAGARPAERLRGGRLLGPMERLLILGFGAAGDVEAAGLVVAAKGLLRFPELQAAARAHEASVDEVTEYFLVGTFTSLLVALASVVVLA